MAYPPTLLFSAIRAPQYLRGLFVSRRRLRPGERVPSALLALWVCLAAISGAQVSYVNGVPAQEAAAAIRFDAAQWRITPRGSLSRAGILDHQQIFAPTNLETGLGVHQHFCLEAVPGPDGTLIVSEIVDGNLSGGSPKAIELTNVGAAPVDLARYTLARGSNGEAFSSFVKLSGSLPAGHSFLVCGDKDPASFIAIVGREADLYDAIARNNGNDSVALFLDGRLVDFFGVAFEDGTGKEWDYTDSYAVRRPDVCAPRALNAEGSPNAVVPSPQPGAEVVAAPPAMAAPAMATSPSVGAGRLLVFVAPGAAVSVELTNLLAADPEARSLFLQNRAEYVDVMQPAGGAMAQRFQVFRAPTLILVGERDTILSAVYFHSGMTWSEIRGALGWSN